MLTRNGREMAERKKNRKPAVKNDVWVVEDNDEFRRELARLLNSSDVFHCEHSFNACEPALNLLRTGALPDLILMDIGLPGMSGIEGIRRAKEISPSVKVVMLTVFEDTDNIVRAIAAGASGYLHKGTPIGPTLESLKSILAGGAPMSPQIARKMLEVFAEQTTPSADYDLTPREREILKLLIDGLTKKEIADKLFLSFHTIDNHLRNIYVKLRVQSRSSAVSKALKERLL
ncbi:MAG: response regulator transcription factor [Methanothrix sp.]|nr:response regulator transcription factor [Methanothrix sp.]